MTVTKFEFIQPMMFECALANLPQGAPPDMNRPMVGALGAAYYFNVPAYWQFCGNVRDCFNQRTKQVSGSSNNLVLTEAWMTANADKSLGDWIAAVSLKATDQINHVDTGV